VLLPGDTRPGPVLRLIPALGLRYRIVAPAYSGSRLRPYHRFAWQPHSPSWLQARDRIGRLAGEGSAHASDPEGVRFPTAGLERRGRFDLESTPHAAAGTVRGGQMNGLGGSRRERSARVARVVAALLLLIFAALMPGTAVAKPAGPGVTPIVLFPAWHFTRLTFTVKHQTTDPNCRGSGTFEDLVFKDPGPAFSQVCRDELMTLRYDRRSHKPMRLRFDEQRGVTVSIPDYGKTASAPFYEPMYKALEAVGYTRDQDIRVAGYDARLTPDMGGFLPRTKRLIEQTYRENGRRPVHLVGHSNGPIYIQYLLTHTSPAWKSKYIHGFTPLAGNFPGQGLGYALMFVGLNIPDLSFPATPENAVSSARMFLSHPSTFITASDPRIFHDDEIIIHDQSTDAFYTPEDYPRLFDDAGLSWVKPIADYYIGGVPFADPAHFPNVDVYAEKGSGIDTLVGLGLTDLTVGQLVTDTTEFFTRDGDINQEDITNDAVNAWTAMSCWHFSLTDNPGVNHFQLPSNPAVLARLITDANAPRSNCPAGSR
jgi:lysophospholipase-3